MPVWATVLISCSTAIASVIVALIGYKTATRERESKRNKELIEKNKKIIAEMDEANEHGQDKKLQELLEKMETLSSEVGELGTTTKRNGEQIAALFALSNANFRYSQSMSRVITSIGTALVHSDSLDEDSISEIHEAISKHQNDEAEILNQIYKVSY